MANPGLGVLPKLRTGQSRLVAFYPSKVFRSLDLLVKMKPVWSADACGNIVIRLADRPVYQFLKGLMYMLNPSLQ